MRVAQVQSVITGSLDIPTEWWFGMGIRIAHIVRIFQPLALKSTEPLSLDCVRIVLAQWLITMEK